MFAYQYIIYILPPMDEITNSDSRAKHNKPLPSCYMSEEDKSDLLEDKDKKLFMRLIGILQWININERIDICYSENAMSRFNQCPYVCKLKYVTESITS